MNWLTFSCRTSPVRLRKGNLLLKTSMIEDAVRYLFTVCFLEHSFREQLPDNVHSFVRTISLLLDRMNCGYLSDAYRNNFIRTQSQVKIDHRHIEMGSLRVNARCTDGLTLTSCTLSLLNMNENRYYSKDDAFLPCIFSMPRTVIMINMIDE